MRAKSQKLAKIPVKVKPNEQKVLKPKVQEQTIQEKKVKLSQGQKDRLRKKRKKAREYLEKFCPRVHRTDRIRVLMNHFPRLQSQAR